MTHIKVPKDRVGAIIGPKGRVKQIIEEKSTASLDIDSEEGTVEIIPGEDPVGAMKAEDVINAIARGFNGLFCLLVLFFSCSSDNFKF